jgi:hypothetical protein
MRSVSLGVAIHSRRAPLRDYGSPRRCAPRDDGIRSNKKQNALGSAAFAGTPRPPQTRPCPKGAAARRSGVFRKNSIFCFRFDGAFRSPRRSRRLLFDIEITIEIPQRAGARVEIRRPVRHAFRRKPRFSWGKCESTPRGGPFLPPLTRRKRSVSPAYSAFYRDCGLYREAWRDSTPARPFRTGERLAASARGFRFDRRVVSATAGGRFVSS